MGDIFWGLSARSTSATWLLLIENTKAAPAGKPYNFSGLLEGANKYRAESQSAPSRAYYRSSGCSAGNGCQVAKFLQNGSGYRTRAADAYVGLNVEGCFAVSTRRGAKARGRFLLRDLALSFPIFRDPVRVPDHNACYPRIARHPRATARAFTSLFGYHTRRKSVLPAVLFQLPGSSLVTESRRRLLVRSLLLEDHSSSETNSTLHT
jgi:hypothetical protein